jgi:ubiquinone/menaquinone biosynthesis C-methylase UbiE
LDVHDYFSDFYRKDIIASWKNRSEPNQAEIFLINKYFEDTGKKVLEAGTGGGLLSFYMEELGFCDQYAFDIIPEMIETALIRAKARNSRIKFEIANATALERYPSEEFDYLIYLGQIFCMIPIEFLQNAIDEAYRVTKNNGIMICSFMDWDARWYNPIISTMINGHRILTGQPLSKYHLPQLRLHGKFNYKYFFSRECTCYWPKADVIIKKLEAAGFYFEAVYKEEELTSTKGAANFIICSKPSIDSV